MAFRDWVRDKTLLVFKRRFHGLALMIRRTAYWLNAKVSWILSGIIDVASKVWLFFSGDTKRRALRESPTAETTKKPTPSLILNEHFYQRGILLVTPEDFKGQEIFEEDDSFSLNDRRFYFSDKAQTEKKLKPSPGDIKKALSLIAPLKKFTQFHDAEMTTYGDRFFLFNNRHREEIFFPIRLPAKSSDMDRKQFGMFLFPWVAKRKKSFAESFNGFSNFVTAGCMFGSSLTAVDGQGTTFALIDHHLQLSPGQKIKDIHYKKEDSVAYEQVLFDQIEKQCAFINALSEPDKPKHLVFHLPAYDYILFGAKLFLNGYLSKPSLSKLILLCLQKKEEYITAISSVCSKYDISVKFVSPFDNLFGTLSASQSDKLHRVLSAVGLEHYSFIKNIDMAQLEKLFVIKCLHGLTTHTYDEAQQVVWKDLLRLSVGINDIQFESILNMANASVIATAAKGKTDYQTCSLLPITEKQIQIQYESYSKKSSPETKDSVKETKSSVSNRYPAVFNATFFEQLLAYSQKTKGVFFYFGESLVSLASMITSKKIFSYADKNLNAFFNQQLALLKNSRKNVDETMPNTVLANR